MDDATPAEPDLPDRATWLGDRAVIRVGGKEARAFLNGLVTQDVAGLVEGAPRWSGLLTPQGKALFDFFLWADGAEDVLLDCEAAVAEALVRRLTLYRLRRAVTVAIEPGIAVHWSPDAADRPADPRLSAIGRRWLAPAGEGMTDAASVYRAWRHGHGIVEGVAEIGSDKTLWLEANARELNGVDFTKGCYVGQENTARMHYRQKVNRRLVVVPLDASDPARQRAAFPEEGVAIDHRRVEDMSVLDLPGWLAVAIGADADA